MNIFLMEKLPKTMRRNRNKMLLAESLVVLVCLTSIYLTYIFIHAITK